MMLILVFVSSFFLVWFIDLRVNYIIKNYIDIEVERLTNNIVNKSVKEIMVKDEYSELLDMSNSSNGNDNVSYNTKKINKLTNDVSSSVQNKLLEIDNGVIDDYFILDRYKVGKFKKVKRGIICDISLGNVRGSTLFANVGPTIPIKLSFLGQVNADVDIRTKEYGINNILVKTYLVVRVKEQVSMPITSRRKDIVIRQPIAIDIIKGEIPKYYTLK